MKEKLEKYVGKTGTVLLGGLTVAVKIKDVKSSYGHTRYLITPVAGSREVWVEAIKIED